MSAIAGEVCLRGAMGKAAPAWPRTLDFVVAERDATWADGSARMVAKRLVVDERDRVAALLRPSAAGVVVAIDGHLFNSAELASTLGLAPASADEELIAAAWEKWGDACVDRFKGEFAIAAWDARGRRLLLVADHVASVPLYWTRAAEGRFAFGTELSAVVAAAGVRLEPDWEKIADLLAGSDWVPERTFYCGIQSVPRGCAVAITDHGVVTHRYWNFAAFQARQWSDEQEPVTAARQALERAVAVRLATAAGTAAHMTGGLDSSAVAALAARSQAARGRELPLYSIVPWLPSERAGGDGDYIPAFLRDYPECPHHYVIGEMGSNYPLPGLPNGPVNFQLTSAIREVNRRATVAGCKVMLNGWGGEGGATYPGFGAPLAALRRGDWRWLVREWAGQPSWRRRVGWSRELLFGERTAPFDRGSRLIWPLLRQVLRPEFVREHRIEERCLASRQEASDPLIDGLARCLAGIHRQRRLENWRFQSRAEGFRYRYPLLDREFLEVVATLPPTVFVARGRSRELVRRMVGPLLPPEIRARVSKFAPMVDPAKVGAAGKLRASPDAEAPVWRFLRTWPTIEGLDVNLSAEWGRQVVTVTAHNLLEVDRLLRFVSDHDATRKQP